MSHYRIAALGNSHLAVAKLGWDRIQNEFPDFSIDFFGFPPRTSREFDRHLVIQDGRLVAATDDLRQGFALTSGGRTQIDAVNYSAFLTFGLGRSSPTVARSIYARYRTANFAAPGVHLISQPLLEAYIREKCSSVDALAPYQTLRAVSDAPVLIQSVLTPMTEILSSKKHRRDPSQIPNIYAHLAPIFDRICAEIGQPNLYLYVPQPVETIDPTGLTKAEFVRSGSGFSAFKSGSTKANDYGHGNTDYGVIVMRGLMARLGLMDLHTPKV